jgi:hypothetical protein
VRNRQYQAGAVSGTADRIDESRQVLRLNLERRGNAVHIRLGEIFIEQDRRSHLGDRRPDGEDNAHGIHRGFISRLVSYNNTGMGTK